jgi:hypothetical protein
MASMLKLVYYLREDGTTDSHRLFLSDDQKAFEEFFEDYNVDQSLARIGPDPGKIINFLVIKEVELRGKLGRIEKAMERDPEKKFFLEAILD